MDIDAKHIGNGPQQSFGLTERLVEHQTYRQGSFDGEHRIDRLTASPSRDWCVPLGKRLVGEPHRECAPPDHSCVIVRPIRRTIFCRGDLVAARLVEFVWHGFPHQSVGRPATLPLEHEDRQSGIRLLDMLFVSPNNDRYLGIRAPTPRNIHRTEPLHLLGRGQHRSQNLRQSRLAGSEARQSITPTLA
jgi:hypothetical protein